ncbi:hypothetical protein LCGC14_1311560 [marine sediment metagenome]|uniref:Periplasmic copper-binding protein NosD beta helix domain-containing protein n=1 Tax=marine sediment metagenome TaxID=412755 RepID=A0A0F9N342_9ZZZZ
MRKFSKVERVLFILSLIFGFSILIITNLHYSKDNSSGYLDFDNEQNLKRAGYWNIPPFIIDGNSDWTTFNSTYEWVNGNGTWNDPYIIENITVDGGWSGNGIEIKNSDVYFIIRNSTVYNSGFSEAGIYLFNVKNGKLMNNDCLNNGKNGIEIRVSNNNTIAGNTLNNNVVNGISLDNSFNNSVLNNTANNSEYGIHIKGNYNNISKNIIFDNNYGIQITRQQNLVSENIVTSNVYYGIEIRDSYNTILNNIVSSNGGDGIAIGWSDNGCKILGNIAYNNKNGISLSYSNNHTISGNIVKYSSNRGINLDESHINKVWDNYISESGGGNGYDDGLGNQWDNGTIGNYWDDYTGVDADDDGIGDSAYNISGTASSKDNYPIWDDGYSGSPIVIDGQASGVGAHNWTWAQSKTWCTGSGTFGDPYIIESITIDGGYSDLGITIKNSNVYFVIRNVTVYHSGNSHHEAGIVLDSVSKGSLTDNILSDNFHGIFLGSSTNNSIIGNILTDNQMGIRLRDNSSNNTISENDVFNNKGSSGILLEYGSNNNMISENNASYQTNGAGIVIQQSSNYNMIKNNSVFYNKNGIILSECNGSIISENKAYFNTIRGIAVWAYNYHNNISNNYLNNNYDEGIELLYSDFNIVYNNTVSYNTIGIKVSDSKNNYILSNKIHDNDDGLTFMSGSNNNTSSNNFINNNGAYGIDIAEYADNQTILYNIIENNTRGIRVMSKNNEIFENAINYNNEYGIIVDDNFEVPENNLFYKNNFTNPAGLNAYDNGINNNWDNGSLGNFWADYNYYDNDGDGIGDLPYNISGTAGSKDFFPQWSVRDDISPILSINFPIVNEIFGFNAPEFNITVNDLSPINATWYTIDEGSTNYTFSGLTGFINQTAWNQEVDGVITIRFYANDSLGNLGFKDINISKDITVPKITINSPTPNQLCGVDAPTFSLTIDELNLLEKRYSLNGRLNITFTIEIQISQSEWNNVGNGTVSIMFYVIDLAGNVNSSEVIVRKDIFVPQVSIIFPVDVDIFENIAPSFIVNIQDANLDKMWYKLNFGTQEVPFTSNDTIDQGLWDTLPDGTVILTFYANDTAGNLNFTSVNIIKDTFLPEILILSPNLNDIFGINPPTFELSINEANLVSTWYTKDGGLTNYTFSGTIGTINQDAWDTALEGQITITFYAQDAAGNIGTETVIVIKRIPSESSISGYNIYLLYGVIFIGLIISMKKKHKS